MALKREQGFRYVELANILREQILSGYIKPGEYLLPEHDLAKKYAISRTVLRMSLQLLHDEKLIVKIVGKGTMVSPDLVLQPSGRDPLVILAPYPSRFADEGLPIAKAMFERKCPGVKVNTITLPFEGDEMLTRSHEMGIQPDILLTSDEGFLKLDPGHFHPLHDVAPVAADIYPKILSAFTADDRLYALPVTFSPVFLVYNALQFDRFGAGRPTAGWTLQDFLHAAQLLTRDTDGDGLYDVYGLGLSSSSSRWLSFFLRQNITFRPAEGEGLNTEGIVKTLTFLQSLLYRYRVAPIYALNNYALLRTLFEEGKVAMMQTTSFVFRNEKHAFEPNIAVLPYGSSDRNLLIANALLLPKSGRNGELAKLFLECVLDAALQEQLVLEGRFLSVLRHVNSRHMGDRDIDAMGLRDEKLHQSCFIGELFESVDDLYDIEEEMEMFWAGLESPESTAKKIARIIDRRSKANLREEVQT